MQQLTDGVSKGQSFTKGQMRAFLAACDQLGMPDDVVLRTSTHLLKAVPVSGPLTAITAQWEEHPAANPGIDGLFPPVEQPTAPLPAAKSR